jgi:hypothetical protein
MVSAASECCSGQSEGSCFQCEQGDDRFSNHLTLSFQILSFKNKHRVDASAIDRSRAVCENCIVADEEAFECLVDHIQAGPRPDTRV